MSIIPVFLPYAGCPFTCVYCAQDVQSGTASLTLDEHYQALDRMLLQLDRTTARNIAFYGGTFTNLSQDWQERFLRRAVQARKQGFIRHIRCSTRPDCVDPYGLERLRSIGLDMVELGIQSFQDHALSESRRGYSSSCAIKACHMVADAGLELGVQLMPGICGASCSDFLRDVDETCRVQPSQVRLYPCQVLDNTPLARKWRAGDYRPWALETCLTLLSLAVSRFWSRNIRVIRMGLSPEPGLAEARLAGPWHPALGYMVRSRVLAAHIICLAMGMDQPVRQLVIPKRYESEVYGHKGDRLPMLGRAGITRNKIVCHDGSLFTIISS